jgi:hypothetical protein
MMISENDLPLEKDTMRRLKVTDKALKEVFAEARELSKDIKPNDRSRVVADRGWAGQRYARTADDFLVFVCGYSPTEQSTATRN